MRFIGIDVAQAQLECACRPRGETGTVPNAEAGIRELVARCQVLGPTLIVLEATGGYEATAVAALATATGQLAQTDALDAQVLALVAERVRPEPRPLPDQDGEALDALRTRRRQLVEMLTAERNRLLGRSAAPARPSAACGG